MNGPTCGHCGAAVDAATLCRGCVKTLAWACANIAAYLGDLEVIRTRRARLGDPMPVRRGGPAPLPVDLRFTDAPGSRSEDGRVVERWGQGSELVWVATNTLTTWVRHLLEQHPHLPGPRYGTGTSCCGWLLTHADRIRVSDAGPALLDELLDLERQLRRFVDRPPDLTYVGPCTAGLSDLKWGTWGCGADLYASPGATEVVCRQCNATYEIEERHRWVLAQVEDEWHTATDIAHALVTYSDNVSAGERRLAGQIRKWAERDRLTARDRVVVKGQLVPRYRLGDVLDLVYKRPAPRGEKAG